MSDESDKVPDQRRFLTLLPEVLPAPTRSSNAGSVRQRTLLHLRWLAASAVATATVACSQQTVEPAPKVAPPPDRETPSVKVPETAVRPDMRGYAVVDMLPPPALCSGLAASIDAAAVWRRAGREWVVQITLSEPTLAGAAWSKDYPPRSTHGVIAGLEWRDTGAVIRWRPEPANSSFGSITLHATCPAVREQAVLVSLDLRPIDERREGTRVSLDLHDTMR